MQFCMHRFFSFLRWQSSVPTTLLLLEKGQNQPSLIKSYHFRLDGLKKTTTSASKEATPQYELILLFKKIHL